MDGSIVDLLNARVKLDCEESRQSIAISLSEAPPLAMLCFALVRPW
jgi:hypothetical protein